MKLSEYKDEVLLKLGAPIVEVEIENYVEKIIKASFRELNRYITITKFLTIPYNTKIDLTQYDVAAVQYVMRDASQYTESNMVDAFYLGMTQMNQSYDMTDYRRYLLIKQIKNTISTDLDYDYIAEDNTLYLNCTYPLPVMVTLAYCPRFHKVTEVKDAYWIDMLVRLSLANAKCILSQIRGKFQQSNAIYSLNWEQLASEGQEELKEIREYLQTNYDQSIPID